MLNGQKIELTPEQYQEVSPKKSPFGRKEKNGGAGVCSICYDSQTGDWKTIVKTGNISMFGPTFCCKKVASRAIEVAKEWLSENYFAPEDVFF